MNKVIKKIIKRILIGIVGVLVLVSVVISALYFIDRNKRFAELESNSQLAETSVGPIEYKIYGDKGPVILFLHGSGGGCDSTPVIQPKGYRVLVPSRPGYLRTPLEVGKTPAEQALAFSALLESLDIDEVAVTGVSGGGPPAICFAALYPEKTSALTLLFAVSQPMSSSESNEAPSFLKSDFFTWSLFSLMRNESVLKAMLEEIFQDPNTRQLIMEDPDKKEDIKGFLWNSWPPSKRSQGIQNDGKQFEILALPASNIKVPTLIIHGSEDKDVPVSQSKKLTELIPGSKLVILEGVNHFGLLIKIEEIEEFINEFLDDVNSSKSNKEILPSTLP